MDKDGISRCMMRSPSPDDHDDGSAAIATAAVDDDDGGGDGAATSHVSEMESTKHSIILRAS
jgi:hypothetical protein